jgi:hypothetical protein
MTDIRLQIIGIKTGSLQHYGHFIHDFIMPVIHYIHINSIELKHIYLDISTSRTKLKSFKGIGEKILNLAITEIKEDNEYTKTLPLIKLKSFQFGPYKPRIFNHIIPHIRKTLQIPESPYKVILIQRGFSDTQKCAGAYRRKLDNHHRIKKHLSAKFGDVFKNVILEKISIEEQISLFMNAHIVIGQHGAGLCNIIWMTKPESLIIEFPPFLADTFKNMCMAKGIKHIKINPVPNLIIQKIKRYKKIRAHLPGFMNSTIQASENTVESQ